MSLTELAHAVPGFPHGGQDVAVEIQPQKLPCESVHHVNVFRADIQSARQAGVLNLANEFPVLIEDLKSLVFPVSDPKQALGVDRQAMGYVEFAGIGSFSAPRLDEISVLVELEHARIASTRSGRVPLGDEHVSILRDGDVVRLIKEVRGLIPLAGFAFGPKS